MLGRMLVVALGSFLCAPPAAPPTAKEPPANQIAAASAAPSSSAAEIGVDADTAARIHRLRSRGRKAALDDGGAQPMEVCATCH